MQLEQRAGVNKAMDNQRARMGQYGFALLMIDDAQTTVAEPN